MADGTFVLNYSTINYLQSFYWQRENQRWIESPDRSYNKTSCSGNRKTQGENHKNIPGQEGLIPKTINTIIRKLINVKEELYITQSFSELINQKWKKWKEINFWIRKKKEGITKKDKHKKSKRLNNKPTEYKDLKGNLFKSYNILTTKQMHNTLMKGHSFHNLFYNIDVCEILTSSE
ncbi:hypothetical protein Glove_22g50 [Diversispora epigaea]|uniref:Uncharacterized protein n=1 Tax=Diversispora epigaea TaxID=1348612 RepID=A0A397JJN8_9GLOM|nr:hypothetical protein Glove_22g50 [Diversispora epigaea]